MPHMLMWCHAKDDHIINVALSKGQAKEDLVHHSVKLSMCIFHAKWKKLLMVQLILPILINSPEYSFHLIFHK